MLLIESQRELTRKAISGIVDRILSGTWEKDGLCRLLALRNDLNTSEEMRTSLNRAYEMATAGNTRRAVEELRKHL